MVRFARTASYAKRALFSASMLGGMLAATTAFAAPALPSGGHVAAGSASIGGAGSTLTVSQSSSKAIVDWSSFSIGQGGTVQFDNGSGATLNRVTGGNVSSIDGLLSATGSVYLINPNGVIVGKSGVVNTGGSFVASTLDASNASFLAGGPLTFSGPSTASVINLGKVGSLGGNVGLIAATVRNDGAIAAPKGDVGLAAGSTVVMDDSANDAGGLFSVKVGSASTSVTNAGAISAAAVELRAQQGNVYALAGNTGGVINANGVDASGGVIKLISEGGTTEIAGMLSAQGPNRAGGQIETSGETLDIGAANVNTHGGSWLLDPTDLIVDATAAGVIDGALISGDVTLQTFFTGAPSGPAGSTGNTAAGNGDIIIEHALTWSTGSTLTLKALNALDIDAPITVTGAGNLALSDGASGGLNFAYGPTGFTGNVTFTDVISTVTQGSLTINGQPFALENSIAELASDILAAPTGSYALANSYDASGDGTYGAAPIPTTFKGALEGLGNTISNLTIFSDTAPADEGIGLFASVTGNISDLEISGGNLTGNANVGALAGFDGGHVKNVHSSMNVTGFNLVGGLIGEFGEPGNTLTNSSATGTVTGVIVDASSSGRPVAIGGLVGMVDAGSVTSSFATGAVTALGGEQIGGLIGITNGNNNVVVSNAYATGAVNAGVNSSFTAGILVGGLIGDNGGAVIDSYATGSVLGAQNVGGLIGFNENDAPGMDASNPTGDGTVVKSFATGAVTGYVDTLGNEGIDVGGLVGSNSGAIANAYAMGAVIGGDQIGGLVGENEGSLRNVFSTGLVQAAVGASPTAIGGLIGEDDSVGDIANAYWDTSTSGQPTKGVGEFDFGLVTGVSTANLQDTGFVGVTLGAAFAGGATGHGEDGVYPYLVDFFPNGVQAVSGVAYSDAGVTALAGATVGVIANGVSLGTASTGANGYYYILTAAGGVPSGQSVLAYNESPEAATLATSIGATVTILNLYGNALSGTSSDTTFLQLATDYIPQFAAATGGNSQAASAILNANGLYLIATGASFTLDAAFTADTTDSMLVIKTTAANAPITIAKAVTIDGTNTLELDASGSLSIDAAVSIAGAGIVNLNYGAAGLSFGLTSTGFGGSLSYAVGSGEGIAGQALTINGTPYTLLYSLPDVESIDGSAGAFALAAPITATTTFFGAIDAHFFGTLEGLGNSVSGLKILGSSSYAGLFGELNTGAAVRDLGISGGTFAGFNFVGSLVGYTETGASLIDDFSSGGSVSSVGGADVGGLAGANTGTIAGSGSSDTVGNINAGRSTGGLVGGSGAAGWITASFASGSVTGAARLTGGLVGYNDGAINGGSTASGGAGATGAYVGGLVGYNDAAGTISDDSASGTISTSTNYVGGLVGYNAGTINDGSTSSVSENVPNIAYVGGLVGYNAGGTISDASTSGGTVDDLGGRAVGGMVGYSVGGTISGSSAADDVANDAAGFATGGLVGFNASGSTITTSSATGSVGGGFHYTGGLVGYNAGSISSSFSTGNVTTNGGIFVGGLVGYNLGTISDTYADVSLIQGGDDVGGLVGYNGSSVSTSWSSSGDINATSDVAGSIGKVGGGTITDVYWDEGTSGRTNARASGSATGLTGIGGTTGKDPDAQATYVGFNFTTTWTINPGTSRPFLLNPTPSTPPN